METVNEEIWKDVVGYEDIYQVSNCGNIKRVETQHIKKLRLNQGYFNIMLYTHSKWKMCKVHRIVANAFILNPNNYPCVNHKDECKTNNHVDNLEWCDDKYNSNYGTRNQRIADANGIPVVQKTLDGEFVHIYKSRIQAQRDTGISNTSIGSCINGKARSSGGYLWESIN